MPITNFPVPQNQPQYTTQDFQAIANNAYKMDQERTANELFAKHLDDKGNLNESGFYKDASQAQLAPEYIQRAIDRSNLQKAAQLRQAQADQSMRALGINPQAAGRNTAQIGEPRSEIQYVPNPDATEPSQKLTHEDLWDYLKGKFTGNKASAQGATSPVTQTDQSLVVAGTPEREANDVNVPGSMLQEPDLSYARSATIPQQVSEPDLRSAEQKVSDSYDPSKTTTGQQASRKYFTIDSNVTPEAKSTIITSLQRNGTLPNLSGVPADKQESLINNTLKKTQDAEYDSIGPAPQMFGDASGNVDMNKYAQQEREYQAKVASIYPVWLQKYGKEFADQLGQQISTEGNARANYANNLVKQERQSIVESGYDPTKITSEQARDLNSRRALLTNTIQLIEKSKDDLMGKNGSDAQYAAIVPIMNNWATIERAGTQGGQEKLETMFTNINANLGQAFRQGGVKGVISAMPSYLISNPTNGAQVVIEAVKDAEKYGVLASDIQAAKKTKPKLTIEDVKKHLTSPAKKAPTAPKKDPLGIL